MPIWINPKDEQYKGAGIYLIMSPKGKPYIGQAVNIRSRIVIHKSNGKCAKQNQAKGKKVQAISFAIHKYGWNNMLIKIIKKYPVWDEELLDKKEQFFIRMYNSYKGWGYNCNDGGNGKSKRGFQCSAETRKKMSEVKKGNKYALGYKHSEAQNRAQSKRQMGRLHSAESKMKIILNNAHSKPVIVFKDGVETWCRSASEAARFLGKKYNRGAISSCCRGTYLGNRNTYKGVTFRFAKPDEKPREQKRRRMF